MNPQLIQQACERALIALTIATTKPSPRGDSSGGGGAIEPPLPLPVGIISAKRELKDTLLLWVDLTSDGMEIVPDCDPTDVSMLTWLAGNERATFLAAHEAAGDFLDELTTITKSLENPYLPRYGRKYLGFHGGGDVYVKEGQTEVTLANGETHRITSIQAFNASQMLEREGTASEVADIIKGFFGHALTPKQITMTTANDKRRGRDNKLEPLRIDGKTHIYRVWDVLNRMC